MPKVLTEAQVERYQRDGCLSPVRAMSAERARHYREKFEALEARVPDIKKMKTKSHLLAPWVLEIAEDPQAHFRTVRGADVALHLPNAVAARLEGPDVEVPLTMDGLLDEAAADLHSHTLPPHGSSGL